MILYDIATLIKDFIYKEKHQKDDHIKFNHLARFAKIPRYMEDDHVRLRPLRIFDSHVINNGFRGTDILTVIGLKKPIARSWFQVWWWLKRTYVFLYCIEVDSKRIGFFGMYNLKPGESAEITLVIFDNKMRRSGYGTRAFTVFAQNLNRYSSVEKVIVQVKSDNYASLSFWAKLGFEELYSRNDIRVLSINLKNKSDGRCKNTF